MESLYVCVFSNGHIKVGRSTDPQSRIAAHADRVACLGVELSDRAVYECTGPAGPREQHLIGRCAAAATRRHQNEWFADLEFLDVCEWAQQAAEMVGCVATVDSTFGQRLRSARIAAGLTQADVGQGLGTDGKDCNKMVVSGWESDKHSPRADQLAAICKRLNVSADWLLCLPLQNESPAPTVASGDSLLLKGAA